LLSYGVDLDARQDAAHRVSAASGLEAHRHPEADHSNERRHFAEELDVRTLDADERRRSKRQQAYILVVDVTMRELPSAAVAAPDLSFGDAPGPKVPAAALTPALSAVQNLLIGNRFVWKV
jgi:hypothetical protein